ncbi:MAG TPA: hypothetical protein VEI94_11835 [Candidatus Bathyarchaeia archaeon]|nr:hypothetical protein [Candidatus Bathyarchaeia archaeon]
METRPAAPQLGLIQTEDGFERWFGGADGSSDGGLGDQARIDSGALRLSLAVLEDAMRCVLKHHESRRREQRAAAREALSWIESDDIGFPFAFVNLCHALRLEPEWVRALVNQRLNSQREHRERRRAA